MPKAVADGYRLVVVDAVEIIGKSDDLHTLPIPSYWYLDIQCSGGYRRLTFTDEASRDDFYTALVQAIG